MSLPLRLKGVVWSLSNYKERERDRRHFDPSQAMTREVLCKRENLRDKFPSNARMMF